MAEQQLEEGYAWTQLVCTGKFRTGKAGGTKLGIGFYVVREGKLDERLIFAVTTGNKTCRAGYVYRVEYNAAQGRVKFPRLHDVVGPWHDEGERAAWQVTEKAEEAAARAASNTNENAMAAVLLPLRRAYYRTDLIGKLAIEASLLRCLRYAPSETEL